MKLVCLVDGESTSSVLSVSASTSTTIGESKKLIKAKKAPRFDDVAADELTLWRATTHSLPPTNTNPFAQSRWTPTELDPTDDMAD
ncbi:hypothetical protein BGW42_006187, partial [Actinomortierella wolfii]